MQEVPRSTYFIYVKGAEKIPGLDNKAILRCKNMFALGLVRWLFNRNLKLQKACFARSFFTKAQDYSKYKSIERRL